MHVITWNVVVLFGEEESVKCIALLSTHEHTQTHTQFQSVMLVYTYTG